MTKRWTPHLATVVAIVLFLVLALPFAGLFLFKFYASQLVQQTEESLQGQAVVLAAEFAALYSDGAVPHGDPLFPTISIADDPILPPRADGIPVDLPGGIYPDIGRVLTRVSEAAQSQTLVGYRILDQNGTVIGGSAEIGLSLAHVPEVSAALDGTPTSVARVRVREAPEPFIYNLSRGTRVRIFVAHPVIVDDQVVGAIYLSRTPNHIFRFFYTEIASLIRAGLFVLGGALLIGFLFWRFVTRPINRLVARTNQIAEGVRTTPDDTPYGTREIETLARSFQTMAERLQKRQDTIETFTAHVTHELKSPLSSVQGAAELLLDPDMSLDDAQRRRFMENIQGDTKRMSELLESVRDLARAKQSKFEGQSTLSDIFTGLHADFGMLDISANDLATSLPISADGLRIALRHLLENSAKHGANTVNLILSNGNLDVIDNGDGITDGNLAKVTEPFFTTRRSEGGTGMGLSIVASMMETIGGSLEILTPKSGASIRLNFPA